MMPAVPPSGIFANRTWIAVSAVPPLSVRSRAAGIGSLYWSHPFGQGGQALAPLAAGTDALKTALSRANPARSGKLAESCI
jgi:hypothetical protein